jgi:hypothetical protein
MLSFFVTLLLFFQAQSSPFPEINLSSAVTGITVYRSGALIERQGEVNLKAGTHVLVFSGLPKSINPSSLQLGLSENITLVSLHHSFSWISEQENAPNPIRTRIDILKDSLANASMQIAILEQEKEFLIANKSFGGDKAITPQELEAMANLYRRKITEIESGLLQLQKRRIQLQTVTDKLANERREQGLSGSALSVVKVTVQCESAVKQSVSLRYVIDNASWEPHYELRIASQEKPKLLFRARISQYSGENWDNIPITVSTGNPLISLTAPKLDPYMLSYGNYVRKSTLQPNAPDILVQGRVSDAESEEALIGANITVPTLRIGTTTDSDGFFSFRVPRSVGYVVSNYIGYKKQITPISSNFLEITLKPDHVALEEVVVSSSLSGSLSNMRGSASNEKPVTITNEPEPVLIERYTPTMEFTLNGKQRIPSDGKPVELPLKEEFLDANMFYAATPKLAPNAYVIAEIADWQRLNLISGSVRIVNNGLVLGDAALSVEDAEEKLLVSLGPDREIQLKRELQRDFTSQNFTGSTRQDQKHWEISVKNNKKDAVLVKLEDQYPVSKDKSIQVELQNSSGAIVDAATGKLTWEISLKPGETKKLSVRYLVRRPAGSILHVE